jgi:hypothetical protein
MTSAKRKSRRKPKRQRAGTASSRSRRLVLKIAAPRSRRPSADPASEVSSASFFNNALAADDLFRRRPPITLDGGETPPDGPGILDGLLTAYQAHTTWLRKGEQAHPDAELENPTSLWPARNLPKFSDEIVREQVELVHHATDALNRLQDRLRVIRTAGPSISRSDAMHLVAEAFTTLLPFTKDPTAIGHALKELLRVRFGGRTRAQNQRRALHARIALYEPKADALWRANPRLSKSEVARRIAAEGPVEGDNKPLTVRWLREHLVGPPTS